MTDEFEDELRRAHASGGRAGGLHGTRHGRAASSRRRGNGDVRSTTRAPRSVRATTGCRAPSPPRWSSPCCSAHLAAKENDQQLALREEAAGLEARRELMQALRVTSQKLDLAYEAVNAPPPAQRRGEPHMKTLILKIAAALLLAALAPAALAQSPSPAKGLLRLPEFAATRGQGQRIGQRDARRQAARHGLPILERRGSRTGRGEEALHLADAASTCAATRSTRISHIRRRTSTACAASSPRPAGAASSKRAARRRTPTSTCSSSSSTDKAQGLAIIASEPREFTIVNIVGNIDLEHLHDLEGNFGVPDLGIEVGKTTTPAPAPAPAPKK